MPFIIADRVRETSAVVGIADVSLTGAVDGYRTVASACAVGDSFGYVIQHRSVAEWETGLAVLATPTTFTRSPSWSSAGQGVPCSFSTGDKDVFLTALADSSFVRKTGDTMSGPLVLGADPLLAEQAARKGYVDTVAAPRKRTVAGTADTPTAADIGALIRCTSASPVTITGNDLGVDGFYRVAQMGAGQVSIVAGAGANLVSDKSPPSFATLGRGSVLDVMTDGAGNVLVSGSTAAGAAVSASGSYSGTLSIGAAPAPYQVVQRTTRTGGAFSKGIAPLTIGLTPSAPVALLDYRLRNFDTPTTTLVDWTQAATSLVAGAQSVALNLPATNQWYILDLRPNGDNSKIVSTNARFACGEVIALYGQDIALDGITPTSNDTATTLASLSLTPATTTSCFAITSTSGGVLANNPPAWTVPADTGTVYKGALVAELLNRMVTATAVCCGVIGMGRAGATLATLGSGPAYTAFTDLLTSGTQCGKGFGTLVLVQGQDDAKAGTSASTYQTSLAALVSGLAAAYPGMAFKTIIAGIASHTETTYIPTSANITAIRQGLLNYVAAASGVSAVWPWNAALHTDGWRYTQAGNRTLARHVARAASNALGLTASSNMGPTITAASRAPGSATVTLTVAQSAGTSLGTGSGTLTSLFQVFNAGGTSVPVGISSVTLTNATTITLVLSSTPADSQALDIYYHRPPDSALAAVAYIPDNDTADGITPGRLLAFTSTLPVTVAAPGSVAWAPSNLGSALVFAADTNDTAKAPDDGSGRAQYLRHLYDDAKFLQSPVGANRPLIATNNGMSGTKRVLTLGYGKYLRANGSAFSTLTNLFNGAFLTTNGSAIIAVKLLAHDGEWAAPLNWINSAADAWVQLQQRGTQTNNGQGGTIFRVRDAAAVSATAPDNADDTGWFLFSAIKTASGLVLRKNGVQVGSATYAGSASFTAADFLINASMTAGGVLDTTGDVYTQAVGGMLFANTALSGTDLTNAEAWVAATAGIA